MNDAQYRTRDSCVLNILISRFARHLGYGINSGSSKTSYSLLFVQSETNSEAKQEDVANRRNFLNEFLATEFLNLTDYIRFHRNPLSNFGHVCN
jgi:hypothetical protein